MKYFIVIILFFCRFLYAQSLEYFIQEALENHINIRVLELKYALALEKRHEAQVFPNTVISMGYFLSAIETRTGSQRAQVSVGQMFPWMGTMSARKNYAQALADTKYQDIVIAKKKLITVVSHTYYMLYSIQAQKRVVERNIQLLENYEQWATEALKSEQIPLIRLLQIDIKRNALEAQKEILNEEYATQQIMFNQLLHAKMDRKIVCTQDLSVPTEEESTFQSQLTSHPEVVRYDYLLTSIQRHTFLNQKERLPRVGLRVNYALVDGQDLTHTLQAGKDILVPALSFSIPIFNKKYTSFFAQNQLKKQYIQYQKEDNMQALHATLYQAIHARNAAKIDYTLQVKNLEKLQYTKDLLLKQYEGHDTYFEQLIELIELRLQLEMKQIEAIKNYYIQDSIINYLNN